MAKLKEKKLINDIRLLALDMINNAGIYTSLVREQTPLNEVDLALLLEKPALMAFPAEYRKEKMGGQK